MAAYCRKFGNNQDLAQLSIRVMLGTVMFPHGAQKAFGWFHGPGLQGTLEGFTGMGFPPWAALLLIFLESGGALLLVAGFLSRLWAMGFLVSMTVCMALNHVRHGFFMNWYGQQQGEGFEYHLLVIGICLALIIGGGGRYSLDRLLCRQKTARLPIGSRQGIRAGNATD
jgi:putative oxidoreductase